MSNMTLCCGHQVEDMSETVTVETLENGSRIVGVYCRDCATAMIKSGEATHVSYHVPNYPEDWQRTTMPDDVITEQPNDAPDMGVRDLEGNAVPEVKMLWNDAKSYGGQWFSMEEVKRLKPERAATKGFVVYEDDDCYFIAQTVGESGIYDVFLLPKGCVTDIKRET